MCGHVRWLVREDTKTSTCVNLCARACASPFMFVCVFVQSWVKRAACPHICGQNKWLAQEIYAHVSAPRPHRWAQSRMLAPGQHARGIRAGRPQAKERDGNPTAPQLESECWGVPGRPGVYIGHLGAGCRPKCRRTPAPDFGPPTRDPLVDLLQRTRPDSSTPPWPRHIPRQSVAQVAL